DLLPPEFKESRLYPIGRLDINTTGLLLITNDGILFNRLTHPRFQVEKEYIVGLTGKLSASQKNALEKGILINGEMTAPAKIKLLHNQGDIHYSVIIYEGKKRQIRLIFMAAGLKVVSITRVRIHKLILGTLGLGKVEKLTKDELKSLLGN
ncbi:rRNA pseudouridine synthase, partial [SAR202 cluster bacterium AC-409-J13_OGT_754m]|nr:rRNA pseudouridine synthase [SAR202 cluster bacterium AC-409-J13_OGT_754m]